MAISPFGPNMRSIVVSVDPQKLVIQPDAQQVIDALAKGNTIIPAGNIYVQDSMPVVSDNATVDDCKRSAIFRCRMGKNVYLRDVANSGRYRHHVRLRTRKRQEVGLSADHQEGHRLDADRRGRRSQGDADVSRRRPKDVTVSFEFDESPTVVAAVESVATEGLIGAGLTGLMILMFFGDVRSVIVVVSNIPLALSVRYSDSG